MSGQAFSIFREINYKLSSDEEHNKIRVHKALNYITDRKSTTPELTVFNMVDKTAMLNTFGAFARNAGKDTGRLMKHLIVSYGRSCKTTVDWNEILMVSKNIADFFGNQYQYILSVHNNIPSRPHMHMIMDMYNIETGKKFNQSPNDFLALRDYIDQALGRGNLPLLLRKDRSTDVTPDTYLDYDLDYDDDWYNQVEKHKNKHAEIRYDKKLSDTDIYGLQELFNPQNRHIQWNGRPITCDIAQLLKKDKERRTVL